MSKVAILTPTYNEVNNIGELLTSISQAVSSLQDDVTVFVLDDGSPDGTAELAMECSAKLERPGFSVVVIQRAEKLGLGAAYIDGFHMVIDQGFEFCQQLDADLSHNPAYLGAMFEAIKGNDLVVGSRYVKGGDTRGWTVWRKLLSRCGNLYNQALLGNELHDYTGGFNCFRVSALSDINLSNLHTGYCFLMQLKFRMIQKGLRVVEIPIIFTDRTAGQSKIPKRTMFDNIVFTIQMAATRRFKDV